jgi:hypothetical protein
MCRALLGTVLLLSSAASADKVYNRNRTKREPINPLLTDGGPTARIVGGAPVTPFEHNWVILFRTGGYV